MAHFIVHDLQVWEESDSSSDEEGAEGGAAGVDDDDSGQLPPFWLRNFVYEKKCGLFLHFKFHKKIFEVMYLIKQHCQRQIIQCCPIVRTILK